MCIKGQNILAQCAVSLTTTPPVLPPTVPILLAPMLLVLILLVPMPPLIPVAPLDAMVWLESIIKIFLVPLPRMASAVAPVPCVLNSPCLHEKIGPDVLP